VHFQFRLFPKLLLRRKLDVSYNEATDVLTFSPNGDYVRVKPQPGHPTEE
ncbi:DUF3876 domain-containing protein, partial [Bacteroides acidifaciens]